MGERAEHGSSFPRVLKKRRRDGVARGGGDGVWLTWTYL